MISKNAIKNQEEYNSGKKEYKLLTNNCKDAASDVVNTSASEAKVENPSTIILPNSWFDNLKNVEVPVSITLQSANVIPADATNVQLEKKKYEEIE